MLTCNHRVQVFSLVDGNFLRQWGSEGDGIAVDQGGVFVADTNNHRVQVFQLDGTFVREKASSMGLLGWLSIKGSCLWLK